jgi:hypothetical protein
MAVMPLAAERFDGLMDDIRAWHPVIVIGELSKQRLFISTCAHQLALLIAFVFKNPSTA